MKPKQLQTLLFDMDGVLVLSEKQHFAAWVQVLEHLSLPTDWMDFSKWIGVSDTYNCQFIIEKFKLSHFSIEKLYRLKKQIFIENHANNFEIHAGRNEFLDHLKDKFQVVLVSSASRDEILHILEIENIKHHFSEVIGNEDVEHHKPHPLPYLTGLQITETPAEQALVIEDSESGIQAALQAKIPVAALETPAPLSDEIRSKINLFTDYFEVKKWLFG